MEPRITFRACMLALAMSSAAHASNPKDFVGENVLVMRVDGEIEVDPQGKVASHQLKTEVTEDIRALLAKAINRWTFTPPVVDDKPAQVRSSMRVTLTAQKVDSGYLVRLDEAKFGAPDKIPVKGFWVIHKMKPGVQHPGVAVDALVPVQFLIAPNGDVLDAFVQRCMIQARTPGMDNARVCSMIERNAIRAVRGWKARYEPAPGESMPTEPASGTLPLHFRASPTTAAAPGTWKAEWRTAARVAPWQEKHNAAAFDTTESGFAQHRPVLRLDEGIVGLPL